MSGVPTPDLVSAVKWKARSVLASRTLSTCWQRRVVTPEALDQLSHTHPSAIRARRELGIVNMMMGNYRWLAAQLRAMPPGRILELGAGDGRLGEYLVRRKVCAASRLTGLDVFPKPELWPFGASWREQDMLKEELPEAEIVVANLILHQFEKEQLQDLGRRLSGGCQFLLAVDPHRSRLSLFLGRLLSWVTHMHPLTVHDMILSVHAGFRHHELPDAFGPGWASSVKTTLRGGYRVRMQAQPP